MYVLCRGAFADRPGDFSEGMFDSEPLPLTESTYSSLIYSIISMSESPPFCFLLLSESLPSSLIYSFILLSESPPSSLTYCLHLLYESHRPHSFNSESPPSSLMSESPPSSLIYSLILLSESLPSSFIYCKNPTILTHLTQNLHHPPSFYCQNSIIIPHFTVRILTILPHFTVKIPIILPILLSEFHHPSSLIGAIDVPKHRASKIDTADIISLYPGLLHLLAIVKTASMADLSLSVLIILS